MTPTLLLACTMLLAGCLETDDATEATSLSVTLVAPDGMTQADMGGKSVTLKSIEGRVVTLTTDGEGVAKTGELIPDIYTVAASWDLEGDLYVAGSLPQQQITTAQELTLSMRQLTRTSLVLSKIYMACSKDNNGVNYQTGQYLTIFNQSDTPQDVAGLYIGLLDAGSSMAYTLDNLHEQHADSVVLLKQIYRIPADQPCLLEPATELLICNSAIDHSQYSSMEHSLTDADFEAKDATMKVTNNPHVPALEAVYIQANTTISNINLTRGGPCGVVIFRTDEDVTALPQTYKYPNTATKGTRWVLLPKRMIVDGVDILKYKATGVDLATKRLYSDIDAGYVTLTTTNGWNGEVIYRRLSDMKTPGGNPMLQDTNNSQNDFTTSTTIAPRELE